MTPRLPQVPAKVLIRFLKENGFEEARQKGSHLVLFHPESKNSITLPMHGNRDLGRGLLVKILHDAGFSTDDFITWVSR